MKVSRKVGRRSHRSRYSSISRRRFRSNKNKKNSHKKRYGKTHRGGCWSGAKKGGARSRKYGHKRGKRFHRGGVRLTDVVDGLTFYVKKSGIFPEEPQRFDVTITLEVSGSDVVTLVLTRISSSKEITFKIKGLYSKIIQLLVSPNLKIEVTGSLDGGHIIDFENLKVENGNDTYDFYRDARNRDSFKAIKKKLEELKNLNTPQNSYNSPVWNERTIGDLTKRVNNMTPYTLPKPVQYTPAPSSTNTINDTKYSEEQPNPNAPQGEYDENPQMPSLVT